MATIVVGGHSRNIGKTSVVEGLIASLTTYSWTAVKITQFGHGICSINGKECDCAVDQHPYVIQEENDVEGQTDTSRFLVAGARRVLWVRVKQGQFNLVMPELLPILNSDPSVIIESNSILRFLWPQLYLFVVKYDVEDFKRSAQEFFMSADAVIVAPSSAGQPSWSGISLRDLKNVPLFPTLPPTYVTDALSNFVMSRLNPTK